MEGEAGRFDDRKVGKVFRDYKGRRDGIIKALTTDVDEFYERCDPEKENFCLLAFPDGEWEVTLPAEEVPPEIPEPALGINFARDGMDAKDWLTLVAAHSEGWLFAVAFYFAARFGFDKTDRKMLFNMINDLPTVFEVVSSETKKQQKEKSSTSNHNGSKLKSSSKSRPDESIGRPMNANPYNGEEEQHGNAVCGACRQHDGLDEFWICCDKCETWFHGRCVRITPAKAEHLKHYKCPSCSFKRARP